ncbi:hypothetical protein C8Q76DRAFT_616769 [Earliella scabrosa]|nr:hypothetical protein C8Q76DRAFT_616769 [Earliella scabrosa]
METNLLQLGRGPHTQRRLLPNLKFLRVHAACCRIARLSGIAAEYLDDIYRRLDEQRVLSGDSRSADVLDHVLRRLQDTQAY